MTKLKLELCLIIKSPYLFIILHSLILIKLIRFIISQKYSYALLFLNLIKKNIYFFLVFTKEWYHVLRVTLKHLKPLTPWIIFCPKVDIDMVDAEDAGQIYPQKGTRLIVFRNDTLCSKDTQVCFQSINSIACSC